MAQDPSSGIHQDLLPHLHLISAHRYALIPRVDFSDIAKWLMDAPRIAKNQSPFHWTYLDGPVDGTILLTWQPLGRLGTNFATDGFVWAGPEQYFKQDLGNGLVLEIFHHKCGFLPGEQRAMHSRRRFRLVPSQAGTPHGPQPDISLWLIHYGPAEPDDRIPVSMIPFNENVHRMMNTRQYLKKCGQIQRKDFMLSDRVNWPQIAFPRDDRQQQQQPQPQQQQQMYPSPMAARGGVPQQMAYPTQPPTTGPPAKRARHAASQSHAQQQIQAMPPMEAVYDDEEDTTRGDMFDQLSPREIALARYQQNHEWMEELLSSAYRIDQISPPDLGLGLKGALSHLTEGIFPAQGGEASQQAIDRPYSSTLDPKLADEFRKRITTHMETSKAEIEAMKAKHAKALEQVKSKAAMVRAEKELRDCVEGFGNELWRLEGTVDAGDEESQGGAPKKSTRKLEEIVADVEASLNATTQTLRQVVRVQDGGYQPPAPAPEPPVQVPSGAAPAPAPPASQQPSAATSQQGGLGMDDPDLEMGGTAGELLNQMQPGMSSTSTPGPHGTSALPSTVATPGDMGIPSPAPPTAAPEQKAAPSAGGDTVMGNTEAVAPNPPAQTVPEQDAGSGDWVMVPKGGASPGAAAANAAPAAAVPAKSTPTPTPAPALSAKQQGSAAATPAEGSTGFENDFSSLGDLDSAGDALANYEAPSGGEIGDGLDLNMDMDDSAFGEAFHGVSQAGTPAEGSGENL